MCERALERTNGSATHVGLRPVVSHFTTYATLGSQKLPHLRKQFLLVFCMNTTQLI